MKPMTEAEQRDWWGRTHRKIPSPAEAKAAGWVERDGRWATAGHWQQHDRLLSIGYVEVGVNAYARGYHRDGGHGRINSTVTLLHETVPDWDDYPVP